MSNKKLETMTGKGYYIALILCAVAIGISGYLYYQNEHEPQKNQKPSVQATQPDKQDIQAVATEPQNPEVPSPSAPENTHRALKTGMPVKGETVADYAVDALSYNETTRDWRTHNGVDLAAPEGTPVLAAAEGKVYTVFEDDSLGMTVVIRHDEGYTTQYASLAQEVSVTPGQEVKLGQAIGCVGKTAMIESTLGEHVHFSVTCNDASVNPMEFLGIQ